MKHTNNYHLPQWSEDDLILMEDFNQMNRDIEDGMTNTAAVADAAKSEAEQARFLAQKTAMAAFTMDNLPYKVGQYTGTREDLHITLGFRPSFLIIAWNQQSTGVPYCQLMMTDEWLMNDRVQFTDTGFMLRKIEGLAYGNPRVNDQRTYSYIAFR